MSDSDNTRSGEYDPWRAEAMKRFDSIDGKLTKLAESIDGKLDRITESFGNKLTDAIKDQADLKTRVALLEDAEKNRAKADDLRAQKDIALAQASSLNRAGMITALALALLGLISQYVHFGNAPSAPTTSVSASH